MSAKHMDVANLYGATRVWCTIDDVRHVAVTHGDVPVEHNIGRTTSSRGKIRNGAVHSIRPTPCATATLYTLLLK